MNQPLVTLWAHFWYNIETCPMSIVTAARRPRNACTALLSCYKLRFTNCGASSPIESRMVMRPGEYFRFNQIAHTTRPSMVSIDVALVPKHFAASAPIEGRSGANLAATLGPPRNHLEVAGGQHKANIGTRSWDIVRTNLGQLEDHSRSTWGSL